MARQKGRIGCGGLLGLMLLALIVLIAFGGYMEEKDRKARVAEERAQQQEEQRRFQAMTPEQRAEIVKQREAEAKARQEAEQRRLGLKWSYFDREDKMGRGTIKSAVVKSLNEINLKFPYQGAQRATLLLRKHPEYGKDVILSVENGQLLCEYDGCELTVRFGEGKPVKYSAAEPADFDPTTLFIRNHDRFVANTKKVDKVAVEVQFFQQGNRVFEFDVSGLQWP
ncbi:hypothetical protein [Thioalbus denitrificans]|uniref:Uncharacterized protein n=1 Tax=Thioalbus denitrificans TaxID=547122 RepID=A0A369CG86_9GAMM|nr:hypothetical protein [Thioalbus denitrificans]RCX32095.1 hypothetical protein DFQ59_102448 [Thioalbus denitrificans]